MANAGTGTTEQQHNPTDSQARKDQIRAQAKLIMDNFFIALNSAHVSGRQIGVKRASQTRQPKSTASDESFRQAMFANARSKDIDHIVAEKKSW